VTSSADDLPGTRGAETLLEMTGIVKRFPGVVALGGVDLDVRAGEVHCLLGQNGAGKSTLIKVLSGAYKPDSGRISWLGEEVAFSAPISAVKQGIATIYQELDLVDGLSVADNIFLAHEYSSAGFVRGGETRQAAAALLDRLGHAGIAPQLEVGRLSAAGKQIVSMARALSHDARLIVMDEPSAVLAKNEVDNLFRVIRGLTAAGTAIVYISHRLEEIREIGDRVTVLKDGRTVAAGLDVATTPTTDIVRMMTGRSIEYAFPPRQDTDGVRDQPLLEVESLTRAGEFADVSFTVRPGEIVGLAGLVGSGRSEILETVYGARKSDAGVVRMDGAVLRPGSVRAAVRAGMGLAPEERKAQALFMLASIADNVVASSLTRFADFGWLNRRAAMAAAGEQTAALDLRPQDPRRPVRTLSGGNQQKVVVGRWLLKGCRLLLLDEPTRGVDIGARSELYALIRTLADSGVGVLVVSSEVPEVLGLADRVLVIADGRIVHEAAATDLDEHQVLDLVMEGTAVTKEDAA
jgi:ribose transport system ATP-binding protein